MKKIIVTLVTFISLILLFDICSWAQNNAKKINPNLIGKLIDYNFHYPDDYESFRPVTITKYNDELYLTANYTDVFLLNTSTGDVYKFIAQSDKKKKVLDESKLTFVPTGLFYSKANKKLYIANYKGNNILIFNVDIKNKTLLYAGEIKTKHTIGPENVYVTSNGKVLAAACYDGSAVTLFKLLSPTKYKEVWSTKIGQAHGVSILDNKVYATGLTKRKIYMLNMQTGKIEKSIGNIDSNPKNDGFLWPTCVYPLNKTHIVVSDAHTGYIYILNKDTLEIEKYFGGNGPTYKYLHMPYAILIDGNRYLIASSFQLRIILGNIKTWNAKKSFVYHGKYWRNTDPKKVYNLIEQYSIYNYKKGPKINILGHKYTLGFGHLYPVKNDFPILRLPNIKTLNNDSSYFYFTDSIYIDKNYRIIFSQKNRVLLSLVENGGIYYLVPSKLDSIDYWNIDNKLVNSKGYYNLGNIVKDTIKKINNLKENRLSNGLLTSRDLYNVIYNNKKRYFFSYNYKSFYKRFLEVFKSKEGIEFLSKYLKYEKNKNISKKDVMQLAINYYKKAIKRNYVDMSEFILVQTLTGFKDFNKVYNDKLHFSYLKCKNTHYYAGYEPGTVLTTPSINDYTSPFTIKDSCFDIKTNKAVYPMKVKIIWYSPTLYGVDFQLYGIKDGEKYLLLNIKNNKPIIKNGLAINDFIINSNIKFDFYEFKALKAHGQNRLLLREFKIDGKIVKCNTTKNKKLILKNIIQMNKKIHNLIKYGNGKNYYESIKNGADYRKEILKTRNGHCGNYIYLLYRELKGRIPWRGYDLKTWDNRIHSVLEIKIKNKWKTFDPTLGIWYNYSLYELIENSSKIDKNICKNVVNKFKGYCGSNFFGAISKFRSYITFEDYEPNKFNKENIISIKADGEIKGYTTKALYDGNRNTYFSSNGNNIIIKLKPINIYKISLESYRYFDVKNDREVYISPKQIIVKTYYNDIETNNQIINFKKPFLYKDIFLNKEGLVDKIEIFVNGMYNSSSSFILRSLKLF